MRRFKVVRDEYRKYPDSKITLPERQSRGLAGYDFNSPIDFSIHPGKSATIYTDIKARIPDYEVLMLHIRSSIGIKKNIRLAEGVGIIDSDYYNNPDNDGNIILTLTNVGDDIEIFEQGMKLAQGIFMSYLTVNNETDRKLLNTKTRRIGK